MPVKDNHRTLLRKIEGFFKSPNLYQAEFEESIQHSKGHGRIETRRLVVSEDLPRGFTGFAGVRQLYFLERLVVHVGSGKSSREHVYGMTSLPRSHGSAATLLELTRDHWSIENRNHWVRDVTLGEDASQVRVGHLPQVMSLFRHAVLGLIRLTGSRNVAASRREFGACPRKALRLIGM